MTPQDFVAAMRRTLADERDAIRRLDTRRVMAAGSAKEELLKSAVAASEEDRAALAAALHELRDELRRNLLLLAHTRDCLRDAVALCSEQPARPRLQASL